tara:strand:+ start:641 stop:952 length:312 start_codon:yes stop_codon:yes gene_type:complete
MAFFTTARGSRIPLQFNQVFHTIFPALEGFNLTAYVKEDARFDYLKTHWKTINGHRIEYCKVKVDGTVCYLSAVSSDREKLLPGDLEPQSSIRIVLVPEKVTF